MHKFNLATVWAARKIINAAQAARGPLMRHELVTLLISSPSLAFGPDVMSDDVHILVDISLCNLAYDGPNGGQWYSKDYICHQ